MPLISHFYGILIRMFFNDQEQHHLPHFHAIYGEYSGSFSLDGEIITGNIPKKQLKLIAAWATIHMDNLRHYGSPFRRLGSILPLRVWSD